MEWSFDAEAVESSFVRRWSLETPEAAEDYAAHLEESYGGKDLDGLGGVIEHTYDVRIEDTDVVLEFESVGKTEQHGMDTYVGVARTVAKEMLKGAYEVNPTAAKEGAWAIYDYLPEPEIGEDTGADR